MSSEQRWLLSVATPRYSPGRQRLAPRAPSWFSWTSNIIAGLGFLSLTLLLVDSATTKVNLFTDGVWERGSVYSIIGWQLFAAACVVVSVASMDLRARD